MVKVGIHNYLFHALYIMGSLRMDISSQALEKTTPQLIC